MASLAFVEDIRDEDRKSWLRRSPRSRRASFGLLLALRKNKTRRAFSRGPLSSSLASKEAKGTDPQTDKQMTLHEGQEEENTRMGSSPKPRWAARDPKDFEAFALPSLASSLDLHPFTMLHPHILFDSHLHQSSVFAALSNRLLRILFIDASFFRYHRILGPFGFATSRFHCSTTTDPGTFIGSPFQEWRQ